MGVLSPSPEPCLARHFHSLSREDKCQSLEVSRLPSRILGGAAIVVVVGGEGNASRKHSRPAGKVREGGSGGDFRGALRCSQLG